MDRRRIVLGFTCSPLALMALGACADPCVDDGIGQDHCPEQETEADEVGDGDGDGDGDTEDDEGGTGGDLECPLLDVVLTPQTPTMMLLVDRSSSMDGDFGGQTRWTAVGETLFAADTGVVAPLEDEIRFGLGLYSNPMDAPSCPTVVTTAPDLGNWAAMSTSFDDHVPDGNTPTGESLSAVAADLLADDFEGDKIVVLATDGEPDTCAQPDPNDGQPEAVAAAEAAYADGIRTFVISVGSDVGAEHLQDMANAGAGVEPGDPDATYYQALDADSLLAAFESIIQGVRDCRMDLDMPLEAQYANLCELRVNDELVPYDDPNGWQLNDPTEIELVGGACTSIQEGEVSIEMDCDCDAVEP